jgi:hypothetical protein
MMDLLSITHLGLAKANEEGIGRVEGEVTMSVPPLHSSSDQTEAKL